MKLEMLEYLPEANSRAAPLLFVHGAYHGAWCWDECFLPYFASHGFSSYALSLRGHGKSEGYENLHSFSLNDYMDDVLAAMSLIENKLVLIGHSMGGAIVQKVVHKNSEKVKAVILVASAPPNGVFKDVPRLAFKNMKEVINLSLFKKGNYVDLLTKLFFSKEIKHGDKYAWLLQQESAKARRDLVRQIVPNSINIKLPILVLGSKQDCVISEKTTLYLGKIYKTKPIIFSNISHNMMLDPNWRIVADQILTFLYALNDEPAKNLANQ